MDCIRLKERVSVAQCDRHVAVNWESLLRMCIVQFPSMKNFTLSILRYLCEARLTASA